MKLVVPEQGRTPTQNTEMQGSGRNRTVGSRAQSAVRKRLNTASQGNTGSASKGQSQEDKLETVRVEKHRVLRQGRNGT